MVIDIISYTDSQLAVLADEHILEIKEAQLKKNRLDAALEETLAEEKRRLVAQGIFLSGIWEKYCEKMTAKRDAEVAMIRDALLFYLQYTVRPDEAPLYKIDYGLTMEERKNIVKEYYDTAFTDPQARFGAFAADKTAKQYIGQHYAPLYDYYLALIGT